MDLSHGDGRLIRALGNFSRALSGATGGQPGETLCGRMARTRGHDCLFCRVVGAVLRDPDHCWRMRLAEIQRPTTTRL